jgi:hypothetical protein
MTGIEVARKLARQGLSVFPSSRIFGPGTADIATCDPAMIDCMDVIDPRAVWMLLLPGSGLAALDLPRPRDALYLERDLGALPETLTVTRASSLGAVRWFRVDSEVDIPLGEDLRGTRARFRRFGVLSGNTNPKTLDRYGVADGGDFDPSRMTCLPASWLESLAKIKSVTANPIERHEWSPPTPPDY